MPAVACVADGPDGPAELFARPRQLGGPRELGRSVAGGELGPLVGVALDVLDALV